MNIKKITVSLNNFPFYIIIIIPTLIITNWNCKNVEEKETKKAFTAENLQTAYSKELNRSKTYKAFASQAEKERKREIAHLFRTLARSEEIHTGIILNMMKNFGIEPKPVQEENIPIGTTTQTLKMALSMEEIEYSSMYPNIIHCAELEKHGDCVKQLKIIQDVDAKHGELLRYALYKGSEFPDFAYKTCKNCGYPLTTEKIDKCPCCGTDIKMFERQ